MVLQTGLATKEIYGHQPLRISSQSLHVKPMHSGNCLKHHADLRKPIYNHYILKKVIDAEAEALMPSSGHDVCHRPIL